MQSARNEHEQIRYAFFRVPQPLFHAPRAFHPRQGMFDSDAQVGDLPVRALVRRRQFARARLFFGW
jgi:hypothetical protein